MNAKAIVKFSKNVMISNNNKDKTYTCWNSSVIALTWNNRFEQLIPNDEGVIHFETHKYNCIYRTYWVNDSDNSTKEIVYFRNM